jgi:membrane fusion protein (multidrug efflux system)
MKIHPVATCPENSTPWRTIPAALILTLTLILSLALMLNLAGCGKQAVAPDATVPALLVAPEDLLTVHSDALASGPAITGSVQPERRADLRAEVSAVVLQVLKENGESVRRGDVLLRLDETALRESMSAAEQATRAATQTQDQAERMLQRLTTLRASGMVSTQALEDAEIRRNNAQSELAAARTRAAQARQQLERTLVRAPFDGIVSERKVSNGDTAQIGKELIKVIDPASMRFEGLVSADRIGLVKLGQAVRFRINGYPGQEFSGRVKRIDPAANAVTRQVVVLVDFVGPAQPKVAGLYAEGRIDADSKVVLMLPESALVRAGDQTHVWRLLSQDTTQTQTQPQPKPQPQPQPQPQDQTQLHVLRKVALVLGERDERSGQWEVRSGLAVGDKVLRHPGSGMLDGQLATLLAPAAQPGGLPSSSTPVAGK